MTSQLQSEVAVYGGTAAGVCAAVAAADAGARTLLIEPGSHLGGMVSGGLGYTDVGDVRVLGGAAARFRNAVADHYGVSPGAYAGPEPHVAEAIFRRWLEEAGVDVVFGERVISADVVDGTIRTVTLSSGATLTAAVFIDAGYEGDLMAAAGVPAAVGREDRGRYRERFAGRQELVPGRHTMPGWISPFADDPTGVAEGRLLAQVRAKPMAEVGAGDGGVMSYGYRMCLRRTVSRSSGLTTTTERTGSSAGGCSPTGRGTGSSCPRAG
jgi:hypothetical protein